jgi:hypothetical protein
MSTGAFCARFVSLVCRTYGSYLARHLIAAVILAKKASLLY